MRNALDWLGGMAALAMIAGLFVFGWVATPGGL